MHLPNTGFGAKDLIRDQEEGMLMTRSPMWRENA